MLSRIYHEGCYITAYYDVRWGDIGGSRYVISLLCCPTISSRNRIVLPVHALYNCSFRIGVFLSAILAMGTALEVAGTAMTLAYLGPGIGGSICVPTRCPTATLVVYACVVPISQIDVQLIGFPTKLRNRSDTNYASRYDSFPNFILSPHRMDPHARRFARASGWDFGLLDAC